MANNASNRGTRNPLYDGDNEESTGSNHQLNPTAPANQPLSNEAVSRQLAEIALLLAQLTSQVAIGNTQAQRTDPEPQTQPRVADARPVDPAPPPVQNQPAVPEPVDHYEEEIRRKPPAVPAVSLAPTPMNQIVPYVPPQPSDPLMEKISRLERAVNKLSGDKYDVADLDPIPQSKASVLKWPEIDKYNGTRCPRAHIRMYVGTLQPMGIDNELVGQSAAVSSL